MRKEKRDEVLNLRIPKRVKRNLKWEAENQDKSITDVAVERLDIDEKEDYEK